MLPLVHQTMFFGIGLAMVMEVDETDRRLVILSYRGSYSFIQNASHAFTWEDKSMPHFIVPNGSHSLSSGNTFKWDTTDGPGTTIQYKFQVGTNSGFYNVYNGSWKTGGAPGQWTDNVTGLPGNGGTLYVRALYKKLVNGVIRLYYTSPVAFGCNP